MRSTMSDVILHLVWATWDRAPLISQEAEQAIYADIRAECAKMNADLLEIGGIEDHVHVLVRIPTTVTIAALVKQAKGASSHLATHQVLGPGSFRWQGAYAAFSVSPSDVPAVRAYIRNQKRHHRDGDLAADMEACGSSTHSR